MIWESWFTLSRTHRKRQYFRRSIKRAEAEIYNQEFKKHQFHEMRGGMREQYQWLKERVEQSKRNTLGLKYNFFQESGDPIQAMDLPLAPEEAEALPDKLIAPNRFYKTDKAYSDLKEKGNVDKKLEELKRIIDRREPDLAHQKKNIEGIDAQIVDTERGIGGLHELKASLFNMLKKI